MYACGVGYASWAGSFAGGCASLADILVYCSKNPMGAFACVDRQVLFT